MGALLSFIYGLGAYAASVGALLYLVGFTGNLLVPRSIDVGPGGPWLHAVLVDLALLSAFGLQHSVMARRGFKDWWTRFVPPLVERSTYLFATCLALAMLFLFWLPIPAPVVWVIDSATGVALVWSVFAIGWALVLLSTFLIDHLELFGLRQVYAPLAGAAPAPATFKTPALYRHVRHPLYVGLLLAFWAAPVMTAGRLLFALGGSTYILVGIFFEERDLLAQFGDRYRKYRNEVGMLIPRRSSRNGGA